MTNVSSIMFFFLISPIFIELITTQAIAQLSFLYHFCKNQRGNYTIPSTLHENLNRLLSNDKIDYGFYSSSYGEDINEVHAIGFFLEDVKPDVCLRCLNDSTDLLPQLCPNQKEAIGWFENCMLHYSNHPIIGTMELDPKFYIMSGQNVSSNVDGFNHELSSLLGSLRKTAAAGGSLRKYATGDATIPDFETIYAVAQCTPDLSHRDCNDCLDDEIRLIPQCCNGKGGARIYSPSCYVQYEVYLFYEPTQYDAHALEFSSSGRGVSRIFIIVVVPIVGY